MGTGMVRKMLGENPGRKARLRPRQLQKRKLKAAAKAKAKSRAAAKANRNRPIGIDDILQPLPPGVPQALGFPTAPPSTPSASTSPPGTENKKAQPAMKRPAAKSSPRSKKAKTETGDAAPADASSSMVKDLERKGLVPNTFGGRAKPSQGWALDKYARTAAAFKENIEAKLTQDQAQSPGLVRPRIFKQYIQNRNVILILIPSISGLKG